MNKYKYWLKIALFEMILIIFDQITKYWAAISLKGKNEFNIIKDVLCFHYLDGGNTGAAWGMWKDFFICNFYFSGNCIYCKNYVKYFQINAI